MITGERLKELDKEITELLEQETDESLREWLRKDNKRIEEEDLNSTTPIYGTTIFTIKDEIRN